MLAVQPWWRRWYLPDSWCRNRFVGMRDRGDEGDDGRGLSAVGTWPQAGSEPRHVSGGSSSRWRDWRGSSRRSREPNATVTGAPTGGPDR